ncbi:MAG TPA: MCP four helix bundle domain-containing protein, partial [Rhodoferax sp.]
MKLTVAKKMILLAGSALLGIALLTGLGQQQMNKVYEATNYANVNAVPSILLLDDLQTNFLRLRLRLNRHVLNTDDSVKAKLEATIKEAHEAVSKTLRAYDTNGCLGASCVSDDKEKDMLAQDRKLFEEYEPASESILVESRKGQVGMAKATELLEKVQASADKLNAAISGQINYNAELAKKSAEEAVATKASTLNLSLLIAALTLAAVGFIAFAVTRAFLRQLGGEPDAAADIASKIAAGDLSSQINLQSGDNSSLMAAMKAMNDTLKGVLADTDVLVKAAAVGNLETRADASKHQGDFKKLVQGINDTVKNIAEPMKVTSDYIDQIAKGIIPAQITTAYQGEYLVIRNNLNGLVKMMGDLLKETDILIQGAVVGQLDKRANADMFQGGWKQLVVGVNDTVKNIAEPMKVTSDYIDQIAKGVIPAQITTAYQGEYLVIRNNLNGLVKMMGDLLSETNILIQGAAVGELNKRANADMFQGGWKQLVVGVNDTVKNIAEPMQVTSSYIDQIAKGVIPAQITTAYQGEYLVIRNNLNGLVKMMGDLLSETNILIQGAADGDLDKRANAAQFQGGWNQLVVGVNQIVDGIVLPVNEAVGVLQQMEQGDMTKTVNGNYKGQLNDFKNTVNNTIAKLSQVIGEVNAAAGNIASASEQVSTTAQSIS